MEKLVNTEKTKKKNIKTQYKGSFYTFKTAEISPKPNKNYTYEYIENSKTPSGGVEIIPIIFYKTQKKKKLLTILNFRYALNKYILEFPGGTIDKNEKPEKSAKRELKEETGFICEKMIEIENRFFVDPWKSDDCCRFFLAVIDGERKENLNLEKDFDEIEIIRNCLIDLDRFEEGVEEVLEGRDVGLSIGIGYFRVFKKFFEILGDF